MTYLYHENSEIQFQRCSLEKKGSVFGQEIQWEAHTYQNSLLPLLVSAKDIPETVVFRVPTSIYIMSLYLLSTLFGCVINDAPFLFCWILLLESDSSVWFHLTIPFGVLDYLIYNTYKCRSNLFNILALNSIRHQLQWRVCKQLSIVLAILYTGGSISWGFCIELRKACSQRWRQMSIFRGMGNTNVIGHLYRWREVWWRLK